MIPLKNDRRRCPHGAQIAGEDRFRDHTRRRPVFASSQKRACGQANEVERVGHDRGIVEVVGTPDQASLSVAPGPEVLQMRIADRKNLRRRRKTWTDIEDRLGPAPVSRTQEDEAVRAHLRVFPDNIRLDQIGPKLTAKPRLIIAYGLRDRCHAGLS
jgi:hypothetical protein